MRKLAAALTGFVFQEIQMYYAPYKQLATNNRLIVDHVMSRQDPSHDSCRWLISNEAKSCDLRATVKGGSI